MTMPTASAARSAAAAPARASRRRSSKPIIEAIWAEHIAPKAPLAGPSREVQRLLIDVPIDYTSGNPLNAPAANNNSGLGGLFGAFAGNAPPPAPPPGGGFIEHFRRDAEGKAEDTQYQIVSREDAYAVRLRPEHRSRFVL